MASREYSLGGHQVSLAGRGWSKRSGTARTFGEDVLGPFHAGTRTVLKHFGESGVTDIEKWEFGQDYLGVMHLPKHAPVNGLDVLVLGLADGHGLLRPGKDFANFGLTLGLKGVTNNLPKILDIYQNSELLKVEMTRIFQMVDDELKRTDATKHHTTGGSTLTLSIMFADPSDMTQLVTISANAGDSPLMSIDSDAGKVVELSKQLNCDTLSSYNDYIKLCNERGVKPDEVFMGRFNLTRQGSYKIPCMGLARIENGVEAGAVKPFKLEVGDDGKYFATENTEVVKFLFENCQLPFRKQIDLGGVRTLRDRPAFMAALARGEYPSYNFGNTAEGDCQTLPGSGIGDPQSKSGHNYMLIHTSVTKKNGSDLMVMASDGFYDTMTDEALLDGVSGLSIDECPSADRYMDGLCNRMFEDALKPGTGFPSRKGHPTWDDISMWVVRVNPADTWFVDKLGEEVGDHEVPEARYEFVLGEVPTPEITVTNVQNVTETRRGRGRGLHSRSNQKFRKKREARKRRSRR